MMVIGIILLLDVIALFLINIRIDREAHFIKMKEYLIGSMPLGQPWWFCLKLFLLTLYLPFTIVSNLKHLFKK